MVGATLTPVDAMISADTSCKPTRLPTDITFRERRDAARELPCARHMMQSVPLVCGNKAGLDAVTAGILVDKSVWGLYVS